MLSTDQLRALADSAVCGGVVCAWYAMPDLLPSRGRRVLAKIGLLLGSIAVSATLARSSEGPDRHERSERSDVEAERSDVEAPGTAAAAAPTDGDRAGEGGIDGSVEGAGSVEGDVDGSGLSRALGRLSPAAVAGVVVGSLVLTSVGVVAQERLLHRIGERLAGRGVSHPHTRIGLTLGAAVALTSAAAGTGKASAQSIAPPRDPRHTGD